MGARTLAVRPRVPVRRYFLIARRSSPPLLEGGGVVSLFPRHAAALAAAVRAADLAPGSDVLVPALHRADDVETLRRSGLGPVFYELGDALEPDQRELEVLSTRAVRALYLTHYLGFAQDAARWRDWCDRRELVLIEDAADAYLSTRGDRSAGSFGHVAIVGVGAVLGLAQETALVAAGGLAGAEPPPRRVLRRAARRARRAGPSVLLWRLADDEVVHRRRANYRILLDRLAQHVPPPFDSLPPGASPLAFPLCAAADDAVANRLLAAGVEVQAPWQPHPLLERDRFPQTASRYHTSCVPVHQELRRRDLERIANAVAPGVRRASFVFDEASALDAVRAPWEELAAAGDSVFATWEWASLWWKHFGRGRLLRLVTCRDGADGRVVAILPLYVAVARPLRVARFLGHGPADQLGPISLPGERTLGREALAAAVQRLGVDVLLAEVLPGEQGWSAALDGRVLARESSPSIRFDGGTWDELLASRSANLRQQLRRFDRKLRREHDVRFRLAADPAALADDLDALFALHRARWAGGSSFLAAEAFHREFAVAALRRGWLRLWFLEADGRTVAAWLGFRLGGVESYYQAGRDPSWSGPSPGLLLLAHSIRAALEDGMREYRFLRGDEPFKYRFATDDDGLETVAAASGALGAAAVAVAAGAPRDAIRAFRRRLGP